MRPLEEGINKSKGDCNTNGSRVMGGGSEYQYPQFASARRHHRQCRQSFSNFSQGCSHQAIKTPSQLEKLQQRRKRRRQWFKLTVTPELLTVYLPGGIAAQIPGFTGFKFWSSACASVVLPSQNKAAFIALPNCMWVHHAVPLLQQPVGREPDQNNMGWCASSTCC